MRAVDQWSELERQLSAGWEDARLSYHVEDASSVAAAASVLAPFGPGRVGQDLRFQVARSGPQSADALRNLLRRLDQKRIWGRLELLDVQVPDRVEAQPIEAGAVSSPLADAWDEIVATLPPDWSDLLCEITFDSSDFLARGALLGAPLNPTRNPEALALRFRVSRRGYGASASMARRCFVRMDEEHLTGRLEVVQALSDVGYEATLGPVWRIAGRSV
jgi:hypothetical protein